MSNKSKRPVVLFCRTTETGNIFHVVSCAVRELNNAGKQDEARELKGRVWTAQDYEDALKIIAEYVKLVEHN